jgi:hypothetical protein
VQVLRGAAAPPAERLASLGSLFPAAVPLLSVGTTPPVSPRSFDSTSQLSPLPDAITQTATASTMPPLNDDPFAEANALAEAEHIPAFPLTEPPRPAPDIFDLGAPDLMRMPAAMPKAPAASAPPLPTASAENDAFLSMVQVSGHSAYPLNDDPFADAVEELPAPVDRYAIAESDGGRILTPSSSILPGTPEDLDIPETWDAIPSWATATDLSVTADVVDNMFSSITLTDPHSTLPMPSAPSALTPSASAPALAPAAGTAQSLDKKSLRTKFPLVSHGHDQDPPKSHPSPATSLTTPEFPSSSSHR